MQDISTQVLLVEQVPSRDGQSIRHVVNISGGVASDGNKYPPEGYVTFDQALGTKAQALIKQPTDARVEIVLKPKKQGGGFFTNYVLHDIAPQGMLPPMAMPAAGGTPAQPAPQPVMPPQQPATPGPAAAAPAPTPHTHPLLVDQEAQKSEDRRGFASRDAFEYIGKALASGMFPSLTEATKAAVQLTEDLVRYRGTGTWGEAQTQTPATVAEAVNAEAGASVVQPGVPFDSNPAA